MEMGTGGGFKREEGHIKGGNEGGSELGLGDEGENIEK